MKLLIVVVLIYWCSGNKCHVFDRILYEKIQQVSPCVYRLNGTNVFGCTSKIGGNVGTTQFIYDGDDLDLFTSTAVNGSRPYILVLPIELFNRVNLLRMKEMQLNDIVNGAIFYRGNLTIAAFSNDDVIPNRNTGYYSERNESDFSVWNIPGSGLLHEQFEFPIFYVQNYSQIEHLEKCFYDINNKIELKDHKKHALCAVQLTSFMWARKNTELCYQRTKFYRDLFAQSICDPLGSKNIHTVFVSSSDHKYGISSHEKIVLLVCRLDSTSFFNGIAPGAITVVSNLVSLLSTVEVLRHLTDQHQSGSNHGSGAHKKLVIAFFSGETQDFMGSQRFVFDLKSKSFNTTNFDFDQIDLIIELNQLSNLHDLYAHVSNVSDGNIQMFAQRMKNHAAKTMTRVHVVHEKIIPPSSISSFMYERPDVPSIILTNFNKTFTNQFYNSILDTGIINLNYTYKGSTRKYEENEIQTRIQEVSTVLAYALYEHIFESEIQNDTIIPSANVHLIDELLFCYLENINCSIHRILNMRALDATPNFDVNVHISPNPTPSLAAAALAWMSGLRLAGVTEAQCDVLSERGAKSYVWLPISYNDSTVYSCFYAPLIISESMSPAFELEDYNWTSRRYSTWTESAWGEISIRKLMKPSINVDFSAISFGSVILFLSICLTLFLRSKASVLFELVD